MPKLLDVPDASIIFRSSDHVNFRIHKSVLAMASPFFRDVFSLPQPPDSESIDGLHVVQLGDDAELLNSLISMLYPVHPAIPQSYEKVLYLLAACQKYDMVEVQSSIRAEVNRGSFPAPVGTEVFRAYAIASVNGLIPEMENAGRLTLDYPMTFETLGEVLQFLDGQVLHDLARFGSVAGTILSHASSRSSKSTPQDPQAFGLVVPIRCTISPSGASTRRAPSPAGYMKSSHGISTT